MKVPNLVRAAVCVMLLALAGATAAQQPLTYQGHLKRSGAPFTGLVDLEFRLYDSATGGTQIGGALGRPDWPVEEGLFQVELDFGADSFGPDPRWLQITVDGRPLDPRQRVHATPMAMFALAGNEGPPGPAGPEGPPGDSHWQIDGAATYYTAGPVGIGTATPSNSYALDVQGGEIVRRDSTIGQPQLLLLETQATDFARLNFVTLGGSRLWAIAARSGDADPGTGLMNFFNSTEGDLLTIRGNGPVGVGTTSPQARLSVASQSQWQPLIGNGRGDLYVGDGGVGLSAGVALGGGGRGVSRIWVKGGVEHLHLGSAGHGETLSILPGQVGVDTTSPGNTLDVNGDARIRGLQHGDPAPRQVRVTAAGDLTTAPRPGSTMIPPAAFSPDQDGADYIKLGWLTVFAHLGSFVAPVDLPDGATVTRMTVWFVDESDATNLRARLCADRLTNIASGCIPLADIETSGNVGGIRSMSDNTIEFEPEIDHDRLVHRIIVSSTGPWAGANSALVAVRIDYLEP